MKQSFKTKLKQLWFPKAFRLPEPEFSKDQIDLLEELIQLIQPTISNAEAANKDERVHMAHFLVDLGTGIWRIRRKIEGLTRMPKEIRDTMYSLESTWMSMSEGGVEIVDHIGTIPSKNEAKIVEVRDIPNLAREQVVDAVKPTILLRGEVIQLGEVIMGRPAKDSPEPAAIAADLQGEPAEPAEPAYEIANSGDAEEFITTITHEVETLTLEEAANPGGSFDIPDTPEISASQEETAPVPETQKPDFEIQADDPSASEEFALTDEITEIAPVADFAQIVEEETEKIETADEPHLPEPLASESLEFSTEEIRSPEEPESAPSEIADGEIIETTGPKEIGPATEPDAIVQDESDMPAAQETPLEPEEDIEKIQEETDDISGSPEVSDIPDVPPAPKAKRKKAAPKAAAAAKAKTTKKSKPKKEDTPEELPESSAAESEEAEIKKPAKPRRKRPAKKAEPEPNENNDNEEITEVDIDG